MRLNSHMSEEQSIIVPVLNCLACSGLVYCLYSCWVRVVVHLQSRNLLPREAPFLEQIQNTRLCVTVRNPWVPSLVHLCGSPSLIAIHNTMGPNCLCGLWRHWSLLNFLPLFNKSYASFGRCSQTWYRNIGVCECVLLLFVLGLRIWQSWGGCSDGEHLTKSWCLKGKLCWNYEFLGRSGASVIHVETSS